MNRRLMLVGAMALAGCTAWWTALVRAETLETVESIAASVRAAWETVDSLRADVTVSARLPIGETRLDISGNGTLEFLRHEGKEMYRQRVVMRMSPPHAMDGVSETICNGERIDLVTEFMNNRNRTRVEPDLFKGIGPPGGASLLDLVEKDCTLRVLPDARVDDTDVFVLAAIPKAPQSGMAERKAVLYFDKATGLHRKLELYESAAVITAVTTVSNVKLNPGIDPGRFNLPAPPPPAASAPAAPPPAGPSAAPILEQP